MTKNTREGWKRIEHIRCDLCGRTARWKDPLGGLRCDRCPCPRATPNQLAEAHDEKNGGARVAVLESDVIEGTCSDALLPHREAQRRERYDSALRQAQRVGKS